MSQLVFPSGLRGLGLEVKRTPMWSTLVQTSPSGKELRTQFYSTPRWKYEIPLLFARVSGFSARTVLNEMAMIQGLFMAARGMWDSFLYTDPWSNTATLQSIGTGTGAQTTFQLVDIEGFPVYDVSGGASLFVNGTLTSPASISPTGLVTFSTAPPAGAPVTWSGSYFRRVRFDMDELEMTQLLNLCWGDSTIKLISVK